jgi:hypothetical protein
MIIALGKPLLLARADEMGNVYPCLVQRPAIDNADRTHTNYQCLHDSPPEKRLCFSVWDTKFSSAFDKHGLFDYTILVLT